MSQDNPQAPPRPVPPAAGDDEMAVANRSLADALRLSFRLLSLIMIGAMVWLLLTGMASVQPEERAVRMLFGRILGEGDERVLGEGLKWSWPEPIGRVLRISTEQRSLAIDDFWMFERPAT